MTEPYNLTKKKKKNNSGKKTINLAKFVGAPKDVKVESGVPPLPKGAPWLVCFSHGKHDRATTFYDMEQEVVHVRNIPEMHNKCCILSSYGWLFMMDDVHEEYSRDCFLLNPVSCQKISLPKFPEGFGQGTESGGMVGIMSGAPINNSNCIIICAERYRTNITLCHPNRDKKWTQLSYTNDFDEGGAGLFGFISHHGTIYGLSWFKLVVLQLEHNSIRVIPQGMEPTIPCAQLRNKRMLVQRHDHDEEIMLVMLSYMSTTSNSMFMVNVLGWNACQKDWFQIESIGHDRAIFVCDKFSMLIDVKDESTVKGDCVYISQGGDNSLYLYRFDMTLQAGSTIVPWPNLLSPWSSPLWILPCND